MYKYLLFDLDGTLTDSADGIMNSIEYALKKMGMPTGNREDLRRFIGPPLLDEFMKAYGLSKDEAAAAVRCYREYFSEKGLFENRVYDGIEEVLAKLKAEGRRLIVATSKPEAFTRRIVSHFGLDRYFEFIAAATMGEERTHKDEVIAYALESCGIEKSEALMIGDRSNDVRGAIKNGIDVLAVLYGYGTKEELAEAGAVQFAKTPEDILAFIG